jgi:NADH dehydrogenase/NADH:ubiquinone oxidoreductase subunit G
MPTVTIEGQQHTAQMDETILQVARRADIWIPTLCHHDALGPFASCRICVVEINDGDGWQVVTSCNYPIRRDVTVRVSSERAVRNRQGVMQLLLARCPESLELADLAARMGIDSTPYPHVTEAQRNCILCGRCIRVCEQRIGAAAISPVGRSVERAIAAPFRLPSEDCIGCGACAAVCPVGTIAIRIHPEEVEISPFKTRRKLLKCTDCGRPLASELVKQALDQRGGPNVVQMLAQGQRCPSCKRAKTARELAARAPSNGAGVRV